MYSCNCMLYINIIYNITLHSSLCYYTAIVIMLAIAVYLLSINNTALIDQWPPITAVIDQNRPISAIFGFACHSPSKTAPGCPAAYKSVNRGDLLIYTLIGWQTVRGIFSGPGQPADSYFLLPSGFYMLLYVFYWQLTVSIDSSVHI